MLRLFGAILAAAAPPTTAPAWRPAAQAFARGLAADMRHLLCESAALDSDMQTEQQQQRRQQLARQKELDHWFSAHGREVSLADCKTEEERQRYRDFRSVMANHQFLLLSLSKRRRFVHTVDGYFQELARLFPDSVDALCRAPQGGQTDTECLARLRQTLTERCQQTVQVRSRYFGRGTYTTIGALYYPPTGCIYLNLNWAVESPSGFIDSFEHELWHHLVVRPTPERLSAGLWWEGFNEAISEQWRAELNPALSKVYQRHDDSVEYPVQTAFASLFLGAAPLPTLEHLTNRTSPAQFAAALAAAARRPGARGRLCAALAAIMAQVERIGPDRRRRLEKLMSSWGWKEDDGGAFSLAEWLDGDRWRQAKLSAAFRFQKQALMDLAQADAVLHLQDLRTDLGEAMLLDGAGLSKPLQRNLQKVLDYTRDPFYQYANR